MTLALKPHTLPNRHFLLQLIHDPLTCPKAFAPMRARHSEEKRWFSNGDKTKSVMNDNELKSKSLCGLLGNSFQLVLGHFTMGLVIDSLNFAAILDWSDYAPKINKCARADGVDVARPRRKRRGCHRNFTNDICHAFKLLVTVTDSELNSHKRRYKNEHESM